MEKKAQVSLEYFILFAAIATMTILSFSTFLPKARKAIQGDKATNTNGFFQNAVGEMNISEDDLKQTLIK